MHLGVGLFSAQRRPDDDRQMSEIYSEMVELVQEAEAVGLDSVWASEHHFAEDGYLPGVTTTLGAFAQATDDIAIGSSMILAPFYDPIRLAEDGATLSLLSDGRAIVGLANGYVDEEFDRFGVPKNERGQRTEEALRICRGAWSSGPIGFEPLLSDVPPDTNITPKPDDAPPIIVGAVGKGAVRRTALYADGWVAPGKLSIEEVAKRRHYIDRLRSAEKRDGDFRHIVQQYCWVDESSETAWDTVRDSLVHIQRMYDQWYAGEPVEMSDERVQEIKDQAIFGSPAEVAAEIEEYREGVGDDIGMILRTYQPGTGTDDMRRCLELLGDEVAPEFQ